MDAHEEKAGVWRAMPRTARVVAAGLALYLLAYVAWQVFGGLPLKRAMVADLAYLPLIGVGVWASLSASRRCAGSRRLRVMWLLVAVAMFCFGTGDAIQAVYQATWGYQPYPAVSDVAFLIYYVPMLAAFLIVPSVRHGRRDRVRLGFDAATLALGGSAIVWYVVLGPAAMAASDSLLSSIVSVAYPVGDVVLVVVLAYTMMRRPPSAVRVPLVILMVAQTILVAGNVLYGYLGLHGGYTPGGGVDVMWMVVTALVPLAAATQPTVTRLTAQREDEGVRVRVSWLPYLSMAIGFGLVFAAHRGEPFFPGLSTIIIALAISAFVAVRQLLAQQDLVRTQRALSDAHDELAALATTDPLTALPNHRALVMALDAEIERSRRYGRSFTVMFLDIDHFKAFNDSLGHATGDAALRDFGVAVGGALRSIDTLGRWGGEEFVVVLPETDRDAAKLAAERIRATVANHRFGAAGGTHLTCSIGVATFPNDGADRSTLLEMADRAMYAAKRLGRNQAVSVGSAALAAMDEGGERSTRRDEELRGTVEALVAMVNQREHQTAAHSDDVGVLSRQLALALGCDDVQAATIARAGKLHDIGKVAVPDAILDKEGSLDADEWQPIRRHPTVGADVVSCVPSLRPVAPLIRAHHERWDGKGYPDGLSATDIPLGARIMAVADAFSAMTSDRPYRQAYSQEAALRELRNCAGTQFDPDVVAAMEHVPAVSAERDRVA